MWLPAFRDDFNPLVPGHEHSVLSLRVLDGELWPASVDPGEVLTGAELQVCSSLTILLTSLNGRDNNLNGNLAIDGTIADDLVAGDNYFG